MTRLRESTLGVLRGKRKVGMLGDTSFCLDLLISGMVLSVSALPGLSPKLIKSLYFMRDHGDSKKYVFLKYQVARRDN